MTAVKRCSSFFIRQHIANQFSSAPSGNKLPSITHWRKVHRQRYASRTPVSCSIFSLAYPLSLRAVRSTPLLMKSLSSIHCAVYINGFARGSDSVTRHDRFWHVVADMTVSAGSLPLYGDSASTITPVAVSAEFASATTSGDQALTVQSPESGNTPTGDCQRQSRFAVPHIAANTVLSHLFVRARLF